MSPPRTASPTAATTSVTLTGRAERDLRRLRRHLALTERSRPAAAEEATSLLGAVRHGRGERRRERGDRSGTGDAETDPDRAGVVWSASLG